MMYQEFVNTSSSSLLMSNNVFGATLTVLIIWDLAWRGYALWKAGRNEDSAWFVALLILNTVGILPILYIYLFAKDAKKK